MQKKAQGNTLNRDGQITEEASCDSLRISGCFFRSPPGFRLLEQCSSISSAFASPLFKNHTACRDANSTRKIMMESLLRPLPTMPFPMGLEKIIISITNTTPTMMDVIGACWVGENIAKKRGYSIILLQPHRLFYPITNSSSSSV